MQNNMYMPGMINYKTMKCFYFQRDKYCKYGNACQFAHADSEIKSVDDINYLSSIAAAMNSQYTAGYNYQYDYAEENQRLVNEQMLAMQMMNNYQNNYSQGNQEDLSYTPDTNYGTDSNTNQPSTEYYNQQQYDYSQLQNYGYVYDPNTGQYAYAYDPNYYQYYDNNPNPQQGQYTNSNGVNITSTNTQGKDTFKSEVTSEKETESVNKDKNTGVNKITIEFDNTNK